jgi:ABC-type proline/glycine betaine transport system ATPase subunit
VIVNGASLALVRDLDRFRGHTIGFVFQTHNLIPTLTAHENVEVPMYESSLSRSARRARAEELLELVGLRARMDFLPNQLSGGERQRVGLARALAADPPLLLMDEPFGALDPLTRRRLQDEFKDLQRRLGRTVILVTHDVPEALRLADEVVVMDLGRVAQKASPAELRAAPEPGFVADFLRAALA